ncbi:hypothetical protein F4808DRAFT_459793 [Astrocystis sublimbata]|nr:hypothetical protein F4808DRAFT_459793 [Astrocystis sublimbata]
MPRNKPYDHGLPYPLDSTIPGPSDPIQDHMYKGPRDEPVYIGHIGREADPYLALKQINTLLLIDDSDSMQKCWDEVWDILRIIAPIGIKLDPDGIDIEFVNHRARGYHLTGRSGYEHIGEMKGNLDMPDNVTGIYHNVMPRGKCHMKERLASILTPYMERYEATLKKSRGKTLITPLNVIVITDMRWHVDTGCFKAIFDTARRLDTVGAPKYQAGVQFFRVGDAGREVPEDIIRFLDDGIWKRNRIRDMVDMSTWTGKPGELSEAGKLKVALGGVRRSLDYHEV